MAASGSSGIKDVYRGMIKYVALLYCRGGPRKVFRRECLRGSLDGAHCLSLSALLLMSV